MVPFDYVIMDNANIQDINPAVLKQELLPSLNSSWLQAIPRQYRAIRTGLWSSLVSLWEGIFVECFQGRFVRRIQRNACIYLGGVKQISLPMIDDKWLSLYTRVPINTQNMAYVFMAINSIFFINNIPIHDISYNEDIL